MKTEFPIQPPYLSFLSCSRLAVTNHWIKPNVRFLSSAPRGYEPLDKTKRQVFVIRASRLPNKGACASTSTKERQRPQRSGKHSHLWARVAALYCGAGIACAPRSHLKTVERKRAFRGAERACERSAPEGQGAAQPLPFRPRIPPPFEREVTNQAGWMWFQIYSIAK